MSRNSFQVGIKVIPENLVEMKVLAHILDIKSDDLFLQDIYLAQNEYKTWLTKKELLQKNYPLDYILGKIKILDYDFILNENVLIPRPETEEIIKIIIKNVQNLYNKENNYLVDVGCGSGIIGIILSKYFNHLFLLDESNEALEVTQTNIKINKITNTQVLQSNLIDNQHLLGNLNSESCDNWVLVANLPYVPIGDVKTAQDNKINYEPPAAIYSGEDGLDLFRELIDQLCDKYQNNNIKLPKECYFELDPRNIEKAQQYANKHIQQVNKNRLTNVLIKSQIIKIFDIKRLLHIQIIANNQQ
jgi:release factor glutamine methyltransferase